MKYLVYIFLFFNLLVTAQVDPVKQDSTVVEYIIIEGDSIPRTAIDLDEVLVLPELNFKNRDERIRYIVLRRKTLKVYPKKRALLIAVVSCRWCFALVPVTLLGNILP